MNDQEKYNFEVLDRNTRTKVLVVKDPDGAEVARFHFMQGCPSCEDQARKRAKEFVVRHVVNAEMLRCREDVQYFKTRYLSGTDPVGRAVAQDIAQKIKALDEKLLSQMRTPDRS